MDNIPFLAVFPQPLQEGDEIIIKGHITPNAEQFSVNFVLDKKHPSSDVVYHFKVLLDYNVIVQNYKASNNWKEEIVKDNYYFYLDNDATEFKFRFIFREDKVVVYVIKDDGDTDAYIDDFELKFSIQDIQSVQLWGDVAKVTELGFVYA